MKNLLLIFMSIWTFILTSISSGCMSGGFKWTRKYSQFVNSTHIVLRIVLYVLTFPIYVVTQLVDVVIFNTMDFWSGRVSSGTYHFKKDQHTYVVHHGYQDPAKTLRNSQIEIWSNNQLLETTVIAENIEGEIVVTKNDILTLRASQLSSLPMVHFYSLDGSQVNKTELFIDQTKIAQK